LLYEGGITYFLGAGGFEKSIAKDPVVAGCVEGVGQALV
jgi:hypothetical protein